VVLNNQIEYDDGQGADDPKGPNLPGGYDFASQNLPTVSEIAELCPEQDLRRKASGW